ncbi:hypothetical protein F3Y22_tig00111835pilonHSYRG00055 [Hibiscus syriacus]|uniref:Uncharacterized protein n=1 Tax=Hibiscus syriacus TaxID=106335 RepID=A0A6A2XBP5_HIBSY|nr:hypothetical protein F3Y22_tig00111835pilonHSYRG00055 [Hibiscus syriacus]
MDGQTDDDFIGDAFSLESMLLPSLVHLFDGDVLRLRDEEVNEDSHDDDKAGEEEEEIELQVAKHGEEDLSNDEGEDHVDGDVDGLADGSDLQGAYLAQNQPSQWSPRPCECRHVCVDEEQE